MCQEPWWELHTHPTFPSRQLDLGNKTARSIFTIREQGGFQSPSADECKSGRTRGKSTRLHPRSSLSTDDCDVPRCACHGSVSWKLPQEFGFWPLEENIRRQHKDCFKHGKPLPHHTPYSFIALTSSGGGGLFICLFDV